MSQTPPQEKEALEYLFRAVNEHKHLMATFTLATRYNEVQSLLFFISLSFSSLSPFNSSFFVNCKFQELCTLLNYYLSSEMHYILFSI
jgi:predicted CDP-diglyceride synthetase/phosphatidate cytidylyltransferase